MCHYSPVTYDLIMNAFCYAFNEKKNMVFSFPALFMKNTYGPLNECSAIKCKDETFLIK